ncbi:MAG TPA: aminotransferase class I/II-fold pyridoxal phosphate-dependent enzyme [Gemmatimonadaceae bacterium]|nr:aminotransferase class I/II-fold pyridoxal phosphate-dependent enzyme [Gemmatimonadaceae bacterium]
MNVKRAVSRRGFVGGVTTALGYLTLKPDAPLWAQIVQDPAPRQQRTADEYDTFAKLANNENPYGPSDAVLNAMTKAFKYANRYGYPDGGIVEEIAKHHGVKPENVMLGAGSGEILDVTCNALLRDDKKVVGSDPSYNILYSHATGIKADVIKVPLLANYDQDIDGLVRATRMNHRDVGFLYLCTPNNPTGRVLTKAQIKQVLDGIPEDVPVLIDEAYHHFVEDPAYATSIPYVLEGRRVIVARTFSKIAGLAGMRLGYAIAPRDLLQQMRPYGTGSVNAVVKWGGVAALKDIESQEKVKRVTLELRKKTTSELNSLGFPCIPSDANFFMVHVKRPVVPVIEEFRKRQVLVGRPFPPMNEHLRVSIGTPDEMSRFMVAFKEIVAAPKTAAKTG